jgi:hypothetical protein
MASRRRQEGGKQQHAEGMHGDRTHQAIQEQLKHKLPEPVDPAIEPDGTDGVGQDRPAPLKAHVPTSNGKHRLHEHRTQHDEADKNSEKKRLAKENARGSGGNK